MPKSELLVVRISAHAVFKRSGLKIVGNKLNVFGLAVLGLNVQKLNILSGFPISV